MIALERLAASPLVNELGRWLVLASFSALVIGILLAAALACLSRSNASTRHAAILVAMASTLIVPIVVRLGSELPAQAGVGGLGAPAGEAGSLSGRWLPLVTLAWSIGALLVLARGVLQWLRARNMKTRGTRAAEPAVVRLVERLRRDLRVRAVVRVVESSVARVPTVIGWLEPVLLVPAGLATGFPPEQVRALLAHELAHVRRNDYLVALFQALFESVLFFHPAAWWMTRRLREECEYCCDDIAVAESGDPLAFARALSALEERRCASTLILSSDGGSLMKRVLRLIAAPVAVSSSRPALGRRRGRAFTAGVHRAGAATVLLALPLAAVVLGLAAEPARAAQSGSGRSATVDDRLERLPAADDRLERMRQLEREIAEIDQRIAELRRELAALDRLPVDRRQPGAPRASAGRRGLPRADEAAPAPLDSGVSRRSRSRAPGARGGAGTRADAPAPRRSARSRSGIRERSSRRDAPAPALPGSGRSPRGDAPTDEALPRRSRARGGRAVPGSEGGSGMAGPRRSSRVPRADSDPRGGASSTPAPLPSARPRGRARSGGGGGRAGARALPEEAPTPRPRGRRPTRSRSGGTGAGPGAGTGIGGGGGRRSAPRASDTTPERSGEVIGLGGGAGGATPRRAPATPDRR